MFGICIKTVIVIFFFYAVDVTYESIILPKELKSPSLPVCTSYDGLCGLDYRFTVGGSDTGMVSHSDHQICTCPGTASSNCSVGTEWNNMNNSIVQKLLSGPDQEFLVKISYCQLPEPKRDCRFSEPVLVTRGRGQFMFELVEDMLCRCDRPLVAQASWIQGQYDYIQYGCGQPRCAKKNLTVCPEVTLADDHLKSRSFCRCRRHEMCQGSIPKQEGETAEHRCL